MSKAVKGILLVVALVFFCHNASAGTAYDTYKADAQKAEDMLKKYDADNADLQAYLDAVDSGDQAAWETTRKKSAVSYAIRLNSDKSEVEAVKYQLSLNESMAKIYRSRIAVAEHKADIYFHAYIIQDTAAISEFLSNGLRTIPADISGNIYFAWPSLEIPEGLFSDEDVYCQNCGNVFLATATIIKQTEKFVYLVDINGKEARAMITDEPVSIGETVNVYFTPFIMGKDVAPLIVVGAPEDTIDLYHSLREKE